ncbi:hypothetical protein KSP40_PGU006076 [Platanthera guangdongensis]|uniref:Uncharacterized protein n=1 Tax=Platanthera guangdongensis TaxID=2320717 RepID=A0ABR2N0G3_9ASPA
MRGSGAFETPKSCSRLMQEHEVVAAAMRGIDDGDGRLQWQWLQEVTTTAEGGDGGRR